MKKKAYTELAKSILTNLITFYHDRGSKRTNGVLTLEEVGALNHNLFQSNIKEKYSAKIIFEVSEMITKEYTDFKVKSALEAAFTKLKDIENWKEYTDKELELILNNYLEEEIK